MITLYISLIVLFGGIAIFLAITAIQLRRGSSQDERTQRASKVAMKSAKGYGSIVVNGILILVLYLILSYLGVFQ
jgi:hypothetical protein